MDNQKSFSRLHLAMDAIVIACSYLAAWMLRFVGPFSATAVRARSFEQYMEYLFLVVPVFLILYHAFSLYEPLRMQGRRLVLSNLIKANTLGVLVVISFLYMIDEVLHDHIQSFLGDLINILAPIKKKYDIKMICKEINDSFRDKFNHRIPTFLCNFL